MKKFIGVAVSVLFIGLLAYFMHDEVPSIVAALKNADRGLIAAAAALFLLGCVTASIRLKLIFEAKGIRISLAETLRLTFVGYFFNNFLPTSVGGDIVKAMCAARVTREPVKAVTTVMMDRIFGLFMFVMIPCGSLFFLRGKIDPRVPVIVYTFMGLAIFFFFLLFNPSVARRFHVVENFFNRFRIGTMIRQVYDELHDFKNHKGTVVAALLLSIVGQCSGVLVVYLLAMALGAASSVWLYFFLLVPVVQLISMLPSLNGLGIREGGYIYFLKGYIGTERAAAIGILGLALLLLCSLIGAVIYLLRPEYHVRFNKNNPGGTVLP